MQINFFTKQITMNSTYAIFNWHNPKIIDRLNSCMIRLNVGFNK